MQKDWHRERCRPDALMIRVKTVPRRLFFANTAYAAVTPLLDSLQKRG